jgi:ADP-L-glycero-D-manno-heptose 6-epimerase
MIIVTGAAGFIGSNLVAGLNAAGYKDLVLVDDFTREGKKSNYQGKRYTQLVDRNAFHEWLDTHQSQVQIILHMGARTDTAEFSWEIFMDLNVEYSRKLFLQCVQYGIPLIYASSAATYGLGEHGYHDGHEVVEELAPLNPYGRSKNEFDRWVLKQERKPFFWAGLKFFNVYGPNEYHKGRMASVVFHS